MGTGAEALALTGPTARDGLLLAAGVLSLTAIGFGRLPGVKLSRAVVALCGAGAAVLVGGFGPEAVWAMLDGPVLVLLFSLMLVNGALAEAGLFRWTTAVVTRRAWRPVGLLVALTMVAGALSALFLNDTVVLMLTPLVVRIARGLGLRPLPYLLALALAANVGSVATITGNPQNVVAAVSAGIGYLDFLAALGPPALLGLVVVAVVVGITFRRDLRARPAQPLRPPLPAVRRGRLLVVGLVTLGMLVAFALGAPVPTAALVAGALLLGSAGAGARTVLRRVDMELLVLFGGLFVVVGGLRESAFSQLALAWLVPPDAASLALSGATVVASNLISNVPAVLVLLPAALGSLDPQGATLTLAMAATLAGNLTLVGSMANIIVAEGARRHGEEVGFWSYARVGVPVTLLTLSVGLGWLALR